jgi:hypothetical protein
VVKKRCWRAKSLERRILPVMDFIIAFSVLLGSLILFRILYLSENHAVFQLAMQHKIVSSQLFAISAIEQKYSIDRISGYLELSPVKKLAS